jgi:hypothetical protein
MKPRPARPLIFLELTRFGVVSNDWKWILITSLASYLVPMLLDITVWHIPVVVFTCPLALAGGVIASNLLHKNRPPQWVEHQLRAIGVRLYCRAVGRRPSIRAALPGVDFIPLMHTRRSKEAPAQTVSAEVFEHIQSGGTLSSSFTPNQNWK